MAIAKHAGFLVRWSGILFSFYPGACLSLDQIPEFLHILWPVCEMEGTLSASYFSSLECVYVLYRNIKCFDPSGKLKGVWQYLLHISLLLLQLQSIFIPLRLSQSLLLAGTVLLSTKHVLEHHVELILCFSLSSLLNSNNLPKWATVGKQNDEVNKSLGHILCFLCPKSFFPFLVYPLSQRPHRQPGPSCFPIGPECSKAQVPQVFTPHTQQVVRLERSPQMHSHWHT